MKLALPDLLTGKPTQIKGKEYFATKDYVQPFIDKVNAAGATDIMCFVKQADQVSVTDGSPDPIYNRVLLQAVFGDNCVGSYKKAICMTYSLDVKSPTVKFYKGWMDNDDRFYILSEAFIIVNAIEELTAIDFTPVNTLLNIDDKVLDVLSQVEKIEYAQDTLQQKLGNWIDSVINRCIVNDSGKVKLQTTTPVDVYKAFTIDKDSEYYLQPTDKLKLQDILDKYLDIIRDDDKDITNKAEKAILVGKILGL